MVRQISIFFGNSLMIFITKIIKHQFIFIPPYLKQKKAPKFSFRRHDANFIANII